MILSRSEIGIREVRHALKKLWAAAAWMALTLLLICGGIWLANGGWAQ